MNSPPVFGFEDFRTICQFVEGKAPPFETGVAKRMEAATAGAVYDRAFSLNARLQTS